MLSLRKRLLLGLALSLSFAFTAQWLIARVTIRDLMESFVEHELVEDTSELLSALDTADGRIEHMSLKQVDPAFLSPMSGHYYQIMINGVKAFTSPSLGEFDMHTVPLKPGQTMRGHTLNHKGEPILVGSKGSLKNNQQVTIQIGMGLTHIDETVNDFLWRFLLISLTMIGVLVLLQNWIVSRSLAVLGAIQTDISRVSKGEMQQLNENVPKEIYPLVREINQLSHTLSLRLKRSRDALGNLAHALKTPLTLLSQTTVEKLIQTEDKMQAEHQLHMIQRRIDYELKRARLAGACSLDSPILLKAEIDAVKHALARLYHDKHLKIEVKLDAQLRIHGDREDLLELFGNLLDNACKFAKSQILLTISTQNELQIVLEDDGPGCDSEELKQLTERGVRLDETKQGHGLGLAIVADIVESYSGKLQLDRSHLLGGFKVVVSLPAGIINSHG